MYETIMDRRWYLWRSNQQRGLQLRRWRLLHRKSQRRLLQWLWMQIKSGLMAKTSFFYLLSILSRTVVVFICFFLKNTLKFRQKNLSRKYDESVFINAKTCRCHTCSLVIFERRRGELLFHSRNRKWFFKACLFDLQW